MTAYRIVCTIQVPATAAPTHQHIVEVGTGSDPNKADTRWTLAQVISAMDRGDTFYTLGVSSGKRAGITKFTCSWCTRIHIRSTPDAVPDNNLDNLRRCNWQ
jgi:hypothetical protein